MAKTAQKARGGRRRGPKSSRPPKITMARVISRVREGIEAEPWADQLPALRDLSGEASWYSTELRRARIGGLTPQAEMDEMKGYLQDAVWHRDRAIRAAHKAGAPFHLLMKATKLPSDKLEQALRA